jgi:hypothetical protein
MDAPQAFSQEQVAAIAEQLADLQYKDAQHTKLEVQLELGECNAKVLMRQYMIEFGGLPGNPHYQEGLLVIQHILEERHRARLLLEVSRSTTDLTIELLVRMCPEALELSVPRYEQLMLASVPPLSDLVAWESQQGLTVNGCPPGSVSVDVHVQNIIAANPMEPELLGVFAVYKDRIIASTSQ